MSKLTLLVGLGAGYVLGTRAGRERYDQMKGKAQQLWHDPRTQEKMHQVRDAAQHKMEDAQHKVGA